ncbi:DgyrCDS8164 [Dimorphilus gyrociliatus]|uniref:DgyrCDS8164 n=1 Tax=Dimorphilus gyrociliatus TaxID=2664684 RepID=A0A7I8VTE3_9ANNE|nr:DgyrCDS8164 [Dimorphilus gyrociliatus]
MKMNAGTVNPHRYRLTHDSQNEELDAYERVSPRNSPRRTTNKLKSTSKINSDLTTKSLGDELQEADPLWRAADSDLEKSTCSTSSEESEKKARAEAFLPENSQKFESDDASTLNGIEELQPTHRGCHKFIPKHEDELFIEIGDSLHVQEEDKDLWCVGINLTTGKKGIFPAAYVTDLSLLYDGSSIKSRAFLLQYYGSVEVKQHRGTNILRESILQVVAIRKEMNSKPSNCKLIVNENGIRMLNLDKRAGSTPPESPSDVRRRLERLLSKVRGDSEEHLYSLKNLSFCGCLPENDRYFAFITKHPLEHKFACHVFHGEDSTNCVADSIGDAFKKYYQQYMTYAHPTEDIYIE